MFTNEARDELRFGMIWGNSKGCNLGIKKKSGKFNGCIGVNVGGQDKNLLEIIGIKGGTDI